MSITIYPSQFNMREDGSYAQLPAIKGETGEQGVPGVGALPGGTKGQVPVKQSGTDYDAAWEDIGWKLLWENASPNSSFVAQDVAVDLSDAFELMIYWKQMVSNEACYFTEVFYRKTEDFTYLFNNTAGKIIRRQVFIYADKIHFHGGEFCNSYGSNKKKKNEYCIPCKIYAR